VTPAGRAGRRPVPQIVGLFLIFAATAGLALWQASNHPSPTIFTDELEMTQLARSIAETGHATLRGQPLGTTAPAAAYLSAPLWWIDDVPTAYALVKALGAILMAAAVFPAYGIARLAVRPRWALFAAAGAGISPALAYAPILVKEPSAYPAATLALFLIARWVARPTFVGLLLASGACFLGYLAKDQLGVLGLILALSALAVIWRTDQLSEFRRTWTRGDWVGAIALAVGAVILAGAFVSKRSGSWYVSTTFFQDRMLEYGLWAAGALSIGLGMVPLVAGLASLVRPKGEEVRPGVEALATVTVASIVCLGVYTAVKAAYLSTVFATLTLERNLIFLVPLLFAGTALFLERRGGRWWAVVAAGCFGLYLVRSTPYSLAEYPNYEAHGLAIAALANRVFRWPAQTIEHALVAVTVVTTVVLVLIPRLRGREVAMLAAGLLAAFTLVWTGTSEVYAAHGESLFSKRLYGTLAKPANWLDQSTRGQSVVFLGQGIRDPNPVNLLEFWNRSLTKVWALDGTAPGPGATVTPNVDKPNGTLTSPGTEYVLVTPGVDVIGRRQGEPVAGYSLYRLSGNLRLLTAQTGVYPDGWMGGSASYSLYDVPRGARGRVRIDLSRESWCGKDVRSRILIQVGPVGITGADQAAIRNVTEQTSSVIHSCQLKTFSFPTPPVPWRVEVTIDPTFSPAELDPRRSDPRQLGAVVNFSHKPRR
jgi:hypothetical protein